MQVVALHLVGTVHILQEVFFILLVIRMVASFLPPRRAGVWSSVVEVAERLTEPILDPIRRRVPTVGMLDLSPLVALLLVDVVGALLVAGLKALAGL
ncbi:MAG: YggT family protein [Firmicutes bacterium]|nr:YggT family protein [Alicyclobacillaceae bacterium]MCL6497747.1 YggT family protein [Bacillota bacterium]